MSEDLSQLALALVVFAVFGLVAYLLVKGPGDAPKHAPSVPERRAKRQPHRVSGRTREVLAAAPIRATDGG